LDPRTDCAPRVVPGHEAHSEADQLGDVETAPYRADQLGRRRVPGPEREVGRGHPHSAAGARRVVGRGEAELAGAVRAEQVRVQRAAAHDRATLYRHALAVERLREESARTRALSDRTRTRDTDPLPAPDLQ